jgi:CHAT domain-containing protein/predicted negative regulator of RcsB-dependent stress response
MVINKRLQIVSILVFLLGVLVFGQDKHVSEDKNKKLKGEILNVFESKGEEGLRSFLKNKKDKISNEFILDLAEAGMKGKKEEWLKACEIMAEVSENDKILADVLYKIGTYFLLISNYKKAFEFLEKSLTLYVRINDLVGQGNIFLKEGTIYFYNGEGIKAFELFEKALPFYTRANDYLGQGNYYFRKGEIYFNKGDKSRALEMYEKALNFFEKVNEYIGQGNVLWRKGDIYAENGNYSKALEMYDNALPFFEKEEYFLGKGNLYMSKGKIYSILNDNPNALKMFNRALDFFRKDGTPIGQGNVYWKKGDIYLRKGNNSKALEMYDKAILFLEKSGYPLGLGNLYFSKGEFYFKTGKNLDALLMYDKALVFFKKIDEPNGQGNVYFRKGDIYLRTGNNPKALGMYDKAMPFFKKCGSLLGQGNVYWRKGEIYQISGKNNEAHEILNKALNFYKKAGNLISQGNVYLFQGKIYFKIGNNSRAIEMYTRALNLFEKAQEPQGQASVYINKGELYHRTGDKSIAFDMYNKALPFLEKAKNPIGIGNVYFNKGNFYLYNGNHLKALDMYKKALILYEKAESSLGQGNVYYEKGKIYCYFINDYSKALDMYEKSLIFYKKAEESQGQGYVYQSIGDLYLRIADNSKALAMYEKALPFFESAEDPMGKGNVYYGKGEIYSEAGNYKKSIVMYENAHLFYKKCGDIESESYAMHGKAKVLLKLGKKDEARKAIESGISNLEKIRLQITFSEVKKTYLEKVYEQYNEVVLFMLENKYYDKGFKYTETMRTRVFLDKMAEGLVRLDKGLTPNLKESRDKLVTKLSLISKEMYQTAGKEDEKKLEEIKEQYRKLENDFEDLLIKIRLENPLYASVRYPEPVSVQDLQKNVLKKGEILVRYFISPKKLYVFLISKKSFKVVPIKIEEKKIKNIVERYLLAVKENSPRPIMKYGKILDEKMFKPIEKMVIKSREIIIIPDGELAKIPFEAFIIDKKKSGHPVFLLEKHKIKYIQSASVLSILRKHYHRDSKTRNFIGFGDPVYDYENFIKNLPEQSSPNPEKGDEIKEIHRGKYDRDGGELIRIKGSGQEVKIITELFKKKESDKCVAYLREKASEDNAKDKQMKDFDFIHFSCHGILGDNFQSLVLSQLPPEKSPEDGYLTLNEIMNCNYNAKLVVLSACQTGSGKLEKAEGVTGLTRAVMYAGTPAVMASLWKVDDIATKELMVRFYKNMLEKNVDKVEALRQAKLEILKDKKYSSPFFWSAFVMYGE